tara:strand:+ start:3749 stop:4069 length:321 start_codon:yes stop_codon:yes gene_type:complete
MIETPNLNYIKELAGEDIEFEKKFIKIIKEEFPEEVDTYLGHIQTNELLMAAETVHKLKHKFNVLGLEKAYGYAVTYEENLREGNINMDMDFRAILQKITKYLTTI